MSQAIAIAEEMRTLGYVLMRHTEGSFDSMGRVTRVQTLAPVAVEDAEKNTYSGIFGTGEFPLHTDLAHWAIPPRFVALRCSRGGQAVATNVLDCRQMIEDFGIDALRRILVRPRRPIGTRVPLFNFLDQVDGDGQVRIRWDSVFLRPATKLSEKLLADISEYIRGKAVRKIHLLDVGDTLIIDNWRMLHGRDEVQEHALNRRIERGYLGELG